MTTNIERIIDASEPVAWERYSAELGKKPRVMASYSEREMRRAFKAAFNAGVEFVKTVTDDEEQA